MFRRRMMINHIASPEQGTPVDEEALMTGSVSLGGLAKIIRAWQVRRAQQASRHFRNVETTTGSWFGVRQPSTGGLVGWLVERQGSLPIPGDYTDVLAQRANRHREDPAWHAAQRVVRAEQRLERAYGGDLPREPKVPRPKSAATPHLTRAYWEQAEAEKRHRAEYLTRRQGGRQAANIADLIDRTPTDPHIGRPAQRPDPHTLRRDGTQGTSQGHPPIDIANAPTQPNLRTPQASPQPQPGENPKNPNLNSGTNAAPDPDQWML